MLVNVALSVWKQTAIPYLILQEVGTFCRVYSPIARLTFQHDKESGCNVVNLHGIER